MSTSYEALGAIIGSLVDEKASAYGPAFKKTAQYLELLFPDGIQPEQYIHVGLLIRDFDKTCRIANGHYEDSYQDKAGYALLGEELVRGDVVTPLAPEDFYSSTVPEGVTPVYYTVDPDENWAVIPHGETEE